MTAVVVVVSQKVAFCSFRYIAFISHTIIESTHDKQLSLSLCVCVCARVCVHVRVCVRVCELIIIHVGKDILSLTKNNGILVVKVLLWWIFYCAVNLPSYNL
jgi:hypothetical protein